MALNRSKSRYAIKECSTCGSWYTKECCSIGNFNDQIIVPVSDSFQHCAVCGTPVDGPYCHGCTLIRTKFEKDLFAYCVDIGVFQNFQDISESSNDNTDAVNAPREPSIVDQDPGVNISQDPPQIDHNCAHFGYNCPPKDPIISEPEPCYNQNSDCFPHDSQILPQQYFCCESCGGSHETYQCQPMNQEYFYSHYSGFDQFQYPQFSDVYQIPPVASMEMLHAQADLIESMQNFLMKYDHIPHNEKSIKLLLAEEKFLKIKQVVEEEQFQPEYLQELLENLLKDLQILNEIQLLKQETPILIQKDQEEKNITELLAEERFQKANQALNESQSPQELRIQDLEIQKQQCLEEIIRDGRKKIDTNIQPYLKVAEALPDVRVTVIDCLWSDHNPILLHVSKSDFGLAPFKIFHSWLLRDSFDEVTKTKLPKLEENNFRRKLLSHEKIQDKIEAGSANDDDHDARKKFKDYDSNVEFPLFANSSGLCALNRDSLETSISLEEVKNEVWDCGSSKAPGPDGFSFAFVKKY
ncbi:hypothetical protein Tco_1003572 [Tanacetum coccineum]|uniref:Uncharacterized protein n=1 Tax=Tanacetum coccineum TaxID=301880 RepID=A0ABQ5FAF0_9ASTR